jgi:hypothetical protein
LGDAGGGGSAGLSFAPLDFSLADSLDALALVAAAPLPPPLGEEGGFGGIVWPVNYKFKSKPISYAM